MTPAKLTFIVILVCWTLTLLTEVFPMKKEETKSNSHSQPVDNQIINNLVSNDQVLRNEITKLKSSQNLLVSKLHNLEAFVHDVSNEVARLRSQETLTKTTPSAQ